MASATTFLMFMGDAAPAIDQDLAAFDGATAPIRQLRDDGTVEHAELELAGHRLRIFDAPNPESHAFGFTPAISIFVTCESAQEQQAIHDALRDGGSDLMPLGDYGFSQRFAWIADRFGVSWQLNLP
jgi:predicted 3-demethylubiquinone-9 3-methyltransferase (glyoxalase superfamily)